MPQLHLRPSILAWSAPPARAQSYKTTINQAFEYLKAAKYPEGLALAQRAVAIAERGGATQKDLAYALIMLGNFYSIQGRYADAEPIYKRALAISEKVSGAKSSEYANVLSNLGTFYNNQGRYDEAEALWKRSLAIDEVAWAAMPHVFTSQLENLGKLYVKLGRYAEAEQTLKRTVAIWQAGYGAETPLASRSMGELGNLYRVQGRYAEAEPLLKKAVDLWEKNFSIKPDFAEMMSDLARLYQAQRRFAEAEQYYNRALTTHEKLFGSPNPQIAATHQAIAGMFAAAGEPRKALASSRKAVAMTIAYADSEGQSGARVATTNSAIGLSASYFDDHVSLLAAADRAGIEPHDALAKEGFRDRAMDKPVVGGIGRSADGRAFHCGKRYARRIGAQEPGSWHRMEGKGAGARQRGRQRPFAANTGSAGNLAQADGGDRAFTCGHRGAIERGVPAICQPCQSEACQRRGSPGPAGPERSHPVPVARGKGSPWFCADARPLRMAHDRP